MKAKEFLKTALDQYQEQVSGGGVKIDASAIGLEPFWVFPVQPSEHRYIYTDLPEFTPPEFDEDGNPNHDEERNHAEDKAFYFELCIRLITGRARHENGFSIFDTVGERNKAAEFMRTRMPETFDTGMALDLINQINGAYDRTSIEDATKNSEATTS